MIEFIQEDDFPTIKENLMPFPTLYLSQNNIIIFHGRFIIKKHPIITTTIIDRNSVFSTTENKQ